DYIYAGLILGPLITAALITGALYLKDSWDPVTILTLALVATVFALGLTVLIIVLFVILNDFLKQKSDSKREQRGKEAFLDSKGHYKKDED
ncbi:MAG TPA: hypothetical protein V6C65_39310, partial [Allocoleopsis sp.]